jgi:hypothetical protein
MNVVHVWVIQREIDLPLGLEYLWAYNHKFIWTSNVHSAIHFARAVDADNVIDGFPNTIRGAHAARIKRSINDEKEVE